MWGQVPQKAVPVWEGHSLGLSDAPLGLKEVRREWHRSWSLRNTAGSVIFTGSGHTSSLCLLCFIFLAFLNSNPLSSSEKLRR